MDNWKKLIGKKIRERRIKMGFQHLSDLQKVTGIDVSRLSRWETGKNLPEDEDLKERLLDALEADGTLLDLSESDFQSKAILIAKIVATLSTLNDDQLFSVFTFINTTLSIETPLADRTTKG